MVTHYKCNAYELQAEKPMAQNRIFVIDFQIVIASGRTPPRRDGEASLSTLLSIAVRVSLVPIPGSLYDCFKVNKLWSPAELLGCLFT